VLLDQNGVIAARRRPPALPLTVTVPTAPAFEDFYAASVDRLTRAVAVTLGDHDLATEAVAEAMARALERWNQVSGYDNPSGWVYRVAVNYATSRLRRVKRRVLRAEPPEQAEWMRARDHELATALGRLGHDHRTVVVLRFQLDWTIDQIAEALRVPSGTVKSRLSRALRELRRQMESMGRTFDVGEDVS